MDDSKMMIFFNLHYFPSIQIDSKPLPMHPPGGKKNLKSLLNITASVTAFWKNFNMYYPKLLHK